MKKQSTKGIITIGGGRDYYARLAVNLCLSIRRIDKSIPITLFTTQGLLYPRIWDDVKAKGISVKYLSFDSYTGNNFLRAKLFAYDLSPYDQTIMLDADMMWMGGFPPTQLFASFEGVKFTMANEGHINVRTGDVHTSGIYTSWVDWNQVTKAYGNRLGDKFYQLRSEFIFFEKCKEVRKLFTEALKIYDKPLVRPEKLGGHLADEFAFNLASSITELYPHREQWTPAFWAFREFKLKGSHTAPVQNIGKFALLSIGGNRTMPGVLKYYNHQIESTFVTLHVKGFEKIRDKAAILPERSSL